MFTFSSPKTLIDVITETLTVGGYSVSHDAEYSYYNIMAPDGTHVEFYPTVFDHCVIMSATYRVDGDEAEELDIEITDDSLEGMAEFAEKLEMIFAAE